MEEITLRQSESEVSLIEAGVVRLHVPVLVVGEAALAAVRLAGEEGQVALGALVGVVALGAALEARHLLQRLVQQARRPRPRPRPRPFLTFIHALHVAQRAEPSFVLPHGLLALFRRNFAASGRFVTNFRAVMAHWQPFGILRLFRRRRQFETRVHILAVWSVRTKSGQVVYA